MVYYTIIAFYEVDMWLYRPNRSISIKQKLSTEDVVRCRYTSVGRYKPRICMSKCENYDNNQNESGLSCLRWYVLKGGVESWIGVLETPSWNGVMKTPSWSVVYDFSSRLHPKLESPRLHSKTPLHDSTPPFSTCRLRCGPSWLVSFLVRVQ